MISLQKSLMVFSGNPPPPKFIRLLSKRFAVSNKEKLGKHLGFPMDVDGRSINHFKSIPVKVANTITSWKFKNITQAGKLILINSILIAYASHIMAIFQIPQFILKQITSLLLKFWWAASQDRKPIYWRKRELLERPKSQGGLGLRNLQSLNKALLFKQAWRMESKQSLLISKVFRAKYSSNWSANSLKGKIPETCTWGSRRTMKAVKDMSQGVGHVIGDVGNLPSY